MNTPHPDSPTSSNHDLPDGEEQARNTLLPTAPLPPTSLQPEQTAATGPVPAPTALTAPRHSGNRLIIALLSLALLWTVTAQVVLVALPQPAPGEPAQMEAALPLGWVKIEGNGVSIALPRSYDGTYGCSYGSEESAIIKIPEPWDELPSSSEGSTSMALSAMEDMDEEDEKISRSSVIISQMPFDGKLGSLDKMLDRFATGCACAQKHGRIVAQDMVKLNGVEVGRAEISAEVAGLESHQLYYMIPDGKQLWVVMFIASGEGWSERLKIFERSIATFTIVPERSLLDCARFEYPSSALYSAREMLAFNPEDLNAQVAEICGSLELNGPLGALGALQRSSLLDEKVKEAYAAHELGWKALLSHKYQDAVEHYDRAIELRPENAAYYAYRAAASIGLRRYADAIADYRLASQRMPEQANFHRARGWVNYQLRNYLQVVVDYTDAIDLLDQDEEYGYYDLAALYYQRGEARYIIDNKPAALEDFTSAIEAGDSYKAYWYRGSIYADQRRYDKAIEDYTSALRNQTGEARLYYARALAYRDQAIALDEEHDYIGSIVAMTAAIADMDASIDLESSEASWYMHRGSMYSIRGTFSDVRAVDASADFDAALADFEKAMAMGLKDHYLIYTAAGIQADSKNYEAALELIDKALALDPGADTYLRRSRIYTELGRYEEALADADKARTTRPGDTYQQRAAIELRRGAHTLALYRIKQALQLDPHNAVYIHQRGLIYAAMGQVEEARTDLQAAIDSLEPHQTKLRQQYQEELRALPPAATQPPAR